MVKKTLHFSFKAILFKLKVLGAFGFFAFFLFALFALRVSMSPLDVSFAKDYLTNALRDKVTGNYALMDRVTMHWPDINGPLYLEFLNGQLMNKDGVVILSVDEAAISVSRLGLLQGRVLPKSIILKEPSLRFVRMLGGGFQFDAGLQSSGASSDEQFQLTTRIFNFIARPGVQAESNSLIARLEVFAIEDARVLIDDQIAQQSWSFPDFDMALYSTRTGLKGSVDMVMPDVGLEASGMHLDMDYVWDQKIVALSADLKALDIKALASKVPELGMLAQQNIVFDARVETLLDEEFNPSDIRVQIGSEAGEIVHADLSDAPVPYRDLSLNASYNYSGKTLAVKDTSVTVKDIKLQAEASVTHDDKTVHGPAKLWIDAVEHSVFVGVWPQFLEGHNSEKWIVQRMSGGAFKDVSVVFDLMGRKQDVWDFSLQNVIADFSFDKMHVDYQAPLDAGSSLSGAGRFDVNADSLVIDIAKGKIGEMETYESRMIFHDLAVKGKGHADLSIGLRGNISDMLRYIAKEPIGLNDIGLDAQAVKGQADLRVGLKFPTRKGVKKDEFKVEVDGRLKDVLFPDIVDSLDLSGGPLALTIKKGVVGLKGKAMLESREAELSYETFLDRSDRPYNEKISVKIMADPNIRQMMGVDLSDFIEGSIFADVVYASYKDGTAKADIRADLRPSVFFVSPFGFVKPSGEAASAQMSAYFKNKKITGIKNLEGKGALFSFSDASLEFQQKEGALQLVSGLFPKFMLDQTKGALKFVYDDGGALNLDLDADVLDAQPFMEPSPEGDAPYESPAMKISMQADMIITAPERNLKNGVLNLDVDDEGVFKQWVFDAVAGQGGVSARYQPDAQGQRIFTMKSEDAGALLKALGIFDTMVGGVIDIKGVPLRDARDRSLKGKARIRDFRVIDAPVFAQVLSLLSLQGVPETGMAFEKLEADFNWIYQKGGSVLKLKDGRTSGNSLGLLFEGSYDSGTQFIDLSGTVVPMSGLNKVIGKIPLVGDILTGGSGGVFAATFGIKGPGDDPKVSANPLSVITPGILRRILWE